MKLNKIVAGLLLSGIVLSAATSAQAAVDSKASEGSVKFSTEPLVDYEIIKPGTYEDLITPQDGVNGTKGAIQMNWVPNFRFGEVGTSTITQKYNSLLATHDAGTTTGVKNPQFVQVADARGVDGKFRVTVSASKFASASHTLENTRIQFMDAGKVNTNQLDRDGVDSDASTWLSGVADGGLTGGVRNEIPTEGGAITVLQSGAGYKSGTISSVVFDSEYTSVKDYSAATENAKVKLSVPGGDSPQAGVEYKANLTWTLEDTF